jgi:hypothetical protein
MRASHAGVNHRGDEADRLDGLPLGGVSPKEKSR